MTNRLGTQQKQNYLLDLHLLATTKMTSTPHHIRLPTHPPIYQYSKLCRQFDKLYKTVTKHLKNGDVDLIEDMKIENKVYEEAI